MAEAATMLDTRTKVFAGELKFLPSDGSRIGSAIVYVYGAADEDPLLDELFVRRNDLKLRWAHGNEPDDIIGKITAVRFLDTHVEIDFQLFQTPPAEKIYELMLLGGVTEFSVGFAFEEKDVYKGEDDRWHVRRAELTEVSAVPSGANRETMLTAIKALGKAGRTLSAKNEASLRQARDIIDAVLSSLPAAGEEAKGEKLEGQKPWHIETRGSQYCVIKDEGDEEVACHDTQAEAERHMAALYANEPKSSTAATNADFTYFIDPEPVPQPEPVADDGSQRREELAQRIRVLMMDVA